MGCLTRVVLILALGCVLLIAIEGVFHPWSFYMGGHFHLLPLWQGIGRMHTPAGDYVLYFWMQPTSGGRTYNLPAFRGWGYLCTPRGERFALRTRGGLTEKTGIDTNGKTMVLEFYRRPWYWNFTGQWDQRPKVNFRGTWQNPNLVADDGGTLAKAFNPDGTLSSNRPSYYQANAPNKTPIVFSEVTGWNAYWGDCRQ